MGSKDELNFAPLGSVKGLNLCQEAEHETVVQGGNLEGVQEKVHEGLACAGLPGKGPTGAAAWRAPHSPPEPTWRLGVRPAGWRSMVDHSYSERTDLKGRQ